MPTIVTTTIFVPTFLTKYAENIKRHGHKHVPIIVVGDKKSPSNTREFFASRPVTPDQPTRLHRPSSRVSSRRQAGSELRQTTDAASQQ